MVSVLCAVCGSYGGRVVRRSLSSNCPGAPTPWRQLALRDVLLGFLPRSKRAARIRGEVLCAKSGPCLTRGPFIARIHPATFVAAALRDVLVSLRLN